MRKRQEPYRPALWQGIAHPEPLLSYSERREMVRKQFDGREQELWSPEFYDEWVDYLEEWGWGE